MPLPPQNRPTIAELNEAKLGARTLRATWPLALSQRPDLSLEHLLVAACEQGGKPLRKVRLLLALQAATGCSRVTAKKYLQHAQEILGDKKDVNTLTVNWLLDPHSHGRRLHALADSFDIHRGVPWQGFPYAVGGVQ